MKQVSIPQPMYLALATIITFFASYWIYGLLNDKSQNIPWPIPILAIASGLAFPKRYCYLPILATLLGIFVLPPNPRAVFPSFSNLNAGNGLWIFLMAFAITIAPFILAGSWGHDSAFSDKKRS